MIFQLRDEFIISLFTSRKNNILTPFGRTESYNLLIGIDQGEIIFPLLWTIYFDPLLTELSTAAFAPYIWSSGLSKNILSINNNEDIAVPITQLTYMDDSTLIASSLEGLESLLSIARDFYFLNNITANFQKYELLTYLHSSVILPKVQFRSQVLYLSESQVMRIANGYYSLQHVNPYDSLCERLICRFLAWISLISTGSKYVNLVLITLRNLQGTLKWSSSLDSIDDFSLWTSKRRSISHNWLFQTIKLIKKNWTSI
ncbi:hypothetical protein RhiirA4_483126 [Rhizophagus irregularis]|uniref:Reverse transcriptase domain-containing protein n=1 Tax=Rhizophagus irregularis TaxID=588596 RepID=A0A2I1HM78_9GLOM|nr:hypothetical protein RhiirA4_483126 [Rhizophagus irregularis]